MPCQICDTTTTQADEKFNPHTGKFETVCSSCQEAIKYDILDLDIEPEKDYHVYVDVENVEVEDD